MFKADFHIQHLQNSFCILHHKKFQKIPKKLIVNIVQII